MDLTNVFTLKTFYEKTFIPVGGPLSKLLFRIYADFDPGKCNADHFARYDHRAGRRYHARICWYR